HPRAMYMAAAILAGLALLPGLPAFPFLLLAGAAAGLGVVSRRAERKPAPPTSPPPRPGDPPATQQARDFLQMESLELELGVGLIALVDEGQGGDLLQRISIMRRQIALELGLIAPAARIRDNVQLPPTEYAIRLRGVKVAGGEVLPRYLLALDVAGGLPPIEGIRTKDPSFGLPAVWISPDRRVEAEASGYSVVEPQTVLSTHLMETVRRHAGELLSRQGAKELLDALRETHPALVDDLVPGKLPLGTVHRVLQRLLREGVPTRDLATILEVLSDAAESTKDAEALTEQVRRSLGPVIAQLYADHDGTVRGITIGPRLEAALMQFFTPRPTLQSSPTLDPEQLTGLLRGLTELAAARPEGRVRPLISPPALRVGIRRLIEPLLPELPVVSLGELPPQTALLSSALWEIPRAA
ncbi:MAG: FHIPEP family type III secretion protein, partial [Gemmatimonadales bacterium]|nr:FHIPEP family type III secretion protein [Gemmatimonadales bacterium]